MQLARAAAAGGEEGTGGGEAAGHNRGRIGSKPTSKYTSMEQQVREEVLTLKPIEFQVEEVFVECVGHPVREYHHA